MASEMTAAAAGNLGELRFDPMAMLPFCGYHMADYWQHWLNVGDEGEASGGGGMPRVFYVNWFRKDPAGKWLWPGFGENSRVLKWVCQRCEGKAEGVASPIGLLPKKDALDLAGLDIPEADLDELLKVDPAEWSAMLPQYREHYARFGDKLPDRLAKQLDALEARLKG